MKSAFQLTIALSLLLACTKPPIFKTARIGYGTFKDFLNTHHVEKEPFRNLRFIPAGSVTVNKFDGKDSFNISNPLTVSVDSFWVGTHEVSNKEYRRFIRYTIDSIGSHLLMYLRVINGQTRVDWKRPFDLLNQKNLGKIDVFLLPPEERIDNRKDLDVRKIQYGNYYKNETPISIYPDTLIWNFLPNSQKAKMMSKLYFSNPAYDNYPVVGVSLLQAKTYCRWLEEMWNNGLRSAGVTSHTFQVRLPNAFEWESAAALNKSLPDEIEDSIKPVDAYDKSFLKNMIGNVAEWTTTTGVEWTKPIQGVEWTKPIQIDNSENWKNVDSLIVVKGGSWNTKAFYLQPGTNQFYPANTQKSDIGFRYIVKLKTKE